MRKWLEDPRIARQLGRAHWVVLIVGFVLLTRFPVPSPWDYAALAGLLVVLTLMNVPVAYGLRMSREHAQTKAYKAVAFALGMRALATAFVVTFIAA